MRRASLQGLRVLVTRPAAQAQGLCELLSARGAEVRSLPVQAIEAVPDTVAVARKLDQWRDARWWIFTSINAVRHAHACSAHEDWPPTIAVGRATADALAQLGHTALLPDDGASSEAVLRLPQLQNVAGARIAIVSGENGRMLMTNTLRARGAQVERVEVYRRRALPLSASRIDAALQDCDAALFSNGESLLHLLAALDDAQLQQLRRLQLVLPSRRVVEETAGLALQHAPLVPDHVADDVYVRCLEQWHATSHR